VFFGAAIRNGGARGRVRQRLGIGQDDFVIFTGGKLQPIRRTEFLVDAFRSLARVDTRLIIVGKADERHQDYADNLVALAGDDPRIHFAGWLGKQEMYEHLVASDIAIFPGGQSVIWQQAIGIGLPLIVADRTERVRYHQDARYLNCHDNVIFLDPAQSAAAEIEGLLRDLIDDKAALDRMAQGARQTAEELLDWNRLIARTLRFNLSEAATKRQDAVS
jgi:1,2-diacylglycerol 3-alpha-glucosyltransferase